MKSFFLWWCHTAPNNRVSHPRRLCCYLDEVLLESLPRNPNSKCLLHGLSSAQTAFNREQNLWFFKCPKRQPFRLRSESKKDFKKEWYLTLEKPGRQVFPGYESKGRGEGEGKKATSHRNKTNPNPLKNFTIILASQLIRSPKSQESE